MIVVTGLMRSGTTPLAKMLHQMLIPMGQYMRFPLQSYAAHLEWEDAPLSDPLSLALVHGEQEGFSEFFVKYIEHRREIHGDRWGVKSPFLIPYMGEFVEAARVLGEPMKIVMAQRDYPDTIKSLNRQTEHQSVEVRTEIMQLQERLMASVGTIVADMKIPLENTWSHPRMVARQLAELAGVDADIDVATRGIGGRKERWA